MKRSTEQLQKQVHEYRKRRNEIKKQFGSTSLEYRRKCNKIIELERQLVKSKRNRAQIRNVCNLVKEFTGYSPTSENVGGNYMKQLSRNILYKYGIEIGITGRDIDRYLGFTRCNTATQGRLKFTRSFKTKPENLEMWHRFKLFVKDKKEIK